MTELPTGWTRTTLGEIAETQLGKMLSKKSRTGIGTRSYVRNKNVQWGRIDLSDVAEMDFSEEEFKRFRLEEGDVLACEGGEVGRAAIWRGQLADCAFQKAIHRIRPSCTVLSEYLLYLLWHYADTQFFAPYVTGSTIRHLPQEDLRILPVPLPPLDEQRQIVDAIEEQFSRLDDADGSLTRSRLAMRKLHESIVESLTSVTATEMPLSEVIADTLIGLDRARRFQSLEPPGVPYIRMQDVSRLGLVDTSNVTFVDVSDAEALRYRVEPDDVLFNTRNSVDLVGKVGLVTAVPEGAVFNNNLMRIRTRSVIRPRFLAAAMASWSFRRKLDRIKRATTNVAAIYARDLLPLKVSVPPLDEQDRIVRLLDSQLSLVASMGTAIDAAESRSRSLRRAVLRDAFSGQLVERRG